MLVCYPSVASVLWQYHRISTLAFDKVRACRVIGRRRQRLAHHSVKRGCRPFPPFRSRRQIVTERTNETDKFRTGKAEAGGTIFRLFFHTKILAKRHERRDVFGSVIFHPFSETHRRPRYYEFIRSFGPVHCSEVTVKTKTTVFDVYCFLFMAF